METLAPNDTDKNIFIVHIKNLHQALKHGLKLKKLHMVIRFEKSYCMKPYV